MTLPNVKFTNNLGSVELTNAMIGIADHWAWSSGSSKERKSASIYTHKKQINVTGWVFPSEFNSVNHFEEILTGRLSNSSGQVNTVGLAGELQLPWTTLNDVKILNISMPVGDWIDAQEVSMSFVDEVPEGRSYTIEFAGLELHNPILSVKDPTIRHVDKFIQLPIIQGGSLPDSKDFRPTRYESGYGIININLSGTIFLNQSLFDGVVDDTMVGKIIQRIGMAGEVFGSGTTEPRIVGYPNMFDLGDAIDNLDSAYNYKNVIVAKASGVWDVESESLAVQINMRAQPQEVLGVG